MKNKQILKSLRTVGWKPPTKIRWGTTTGKEQAGGEVGYIMPSAIWALGSLLVVEILFSTIGKPGVESIEEFLDCRSGVLNNKLLIFSTTSISNVDRNIYNFVQIKSKVTQ